MKEFRIGFARTINLGNYQSLRIEATVAYDVDDADDPFALMATAQEDLKTLLRDTYNTQRNEKYE